MEQEPHMTVVWAWLKTVVMLKHPGHLTSMKKLFGDWTSRVNLCFRFSSALDGCSRSFTYGGPTSYSRRRRQRRPAGQSREDSQWHDRRTTRAARCRSKVAHDG
mmetsp:Transcript_11687/g.38448  ORF Transcript_11687/g.38448 Transcript_11687/m.38448 type:complete len:104 (-) Transcript_11687:99-410(-)